MLKSSHPGQQSTNVGSTETTSSIEQVYIYLHDTLMF